MTFHEQSHPDEPFAPPLGDPSQLHPREFCSDESGDLWYCIKEGVVVCLTGIPTPATASNIAKSIVALKDMGGIVPSVIQVVNEEGIAGSPGPTGPAGKDGTNGAGFKWRGEWAVGRAYAINDVVNYTISGVSPQNLAYVCISAHVSTGGLYPSGTGGKWELFVGGGTGTRGPQGTVGPTGATGPTGSQGLQGIGQQICEWAAGITFRVGDYVWVRTYSSMGPSYSQIMFYRCLENHTSSLGNIPSSTSTIWQTTGLGAMDVYGMVFRGTYSSYIYYWTQNVVRYDGGLWIAKQGVSGVTPTAGAYWELLV